MNKEYSKLIKQVKSHTKMDRNHRLLKTLNIRDICVCHRCLLLSFIVNKSTNYINLNGFCFNIIIHICV